LHIPVITAKAWQTPHAINQNYLFHVFYLIQG